MSVTTGAPAGFLLVILGVWLLLQTLVGNLPARIVGLGKSSGGSSPTFGGAGQNAGGPKIGQQLTPAQQQQIQNRLGLNVPAGAI